MYSEWQAAKIRRAQMADYQAKSQVAEFAAHAEHFTPEVRKAMADIIEVKARQNVECGLEEAYHLAIQMDPALRQEMQKNLAAEQARTSSQATARARNAASSIRNSPATPVGASSRGGTVRDDIEAAIEQLSGR
jgi:hypothetical protein